MAVHTFSVLRMVVHAFSVFKNGGARIRGLREKGTNLAGLAAALVVELIDQRATVVSSLEDPSLYSHPGPASQSFNHQAKGYRVCLNISLGIISI